MSLGVLRGMFVSAVTIAVAWATSATARYADYSGARMPFYHEDYPNRDSLPRDDYPERSPDASVPLDYKYEEPSSGIYEGQTENSVGENDAWQIERKNNRLIDEEEDYNHDIDKYSEEREIKSNHRVEDTPSTKGKKLKKVDNNLSHQGRRRFTNSKSRSRYWDQVEDNRDIETRNKIDIRNKFRPRGEVRRAGRRKPREREDVTREAIFEADRNFETGESSEDEALSLQGVRRRVGNERRKDDDSFIPHRDLGSMANKNYPNYEEYYDMKRALNIRNNLLPNPRNKVSETQMPLSVRPLENWFRRANIPDSSDERATLTESTSSLLQTTTTSADTTTLSTLISSLKTTVHVLNSSDLSLAEKSRLSILKKAQRKESIGNTLTTKPPVLMQVTDRLQTVVMVESPGSQLQRMQAREISDDSPDRISRAKRLMRHKLLSNAKNIHELTNNWDELVCDYIDVSLLNKTARLSLQYGIKLKHLQVQQVWRSANCRRF
ncbi:uncharacterized protein LOC125062854 [Pieris napi]|uniref:uncharacterized protein LOC125062854 n=1 Tax=Pieris napi TaxID=78633 RepID=UPI001FBA2AC1|nr:uncharacterized protein LOC125062854 [Pieris napi]